MLACVSACLPYPLPLLFCLGTTRSLFVVIVTLIISWFCWSLLTVSHSDGQHTVVHTLHQAMVYLDSKCMHTYYIYCICYCIECKKYFIAERVCVCHNITNNLFMYD